MIWLKKNISVITLVAGAFGTLFTVGAVYASLQHTQKLSNTNAAEIRELNVNMVKIKTILPRMEKTLDKIEKKLESK